MEWLEIALRCPASVQEAVEWVLNDLGAVGTAAEARVGDNGWLVKAWFPADTHPEPMLTRLRDRLSRMPEYGLPGTDNIQAAVVSDEQWLDAWRKHHRAREIGRRLRILPEAAPEPTYTERVCVVIEPGMAFGTGSHPTTRLTLEYLERLVRPGDMVADVGTGSGILAISAAKLGARTVWASECDSLPREVALRNAEANGVTDRVVVLDPDRFAAQCPPCDLVLCNIIAETILELSGLLSRIVRPGGWLVCSGIVGEKLPPVLTALARHGLAGMEIASDDVWRTALARRFRE